MPRPLCVAKSRPPKKSPVSFTLSKKCGKGRGVKNGIGAGCRTMEVDGQKITGRDARATNRSKVNQGDDTHKKAKKSQ